MAAACPEGVVPGALAGDKGYSSKAIRAWLAQRGIQDVVPTRSNEVRDESFDRDQYRQRNVVERCIGWLKENRRIATRFEKLAIHYMAMLDIAMILRLLEKAAGDHPVCCPS
jgi:transposase